MGPHFKDEDRQRQARRDGQIAGQDPALSIFLRLGLGLGRSAPVNGASGVAGLCDGADQRRGIGMARHSRAFGRKVHGRLGDAGHGAQRPFDTPDARGAGHAVDGEFGGGGGNGISRLFDRAHKVGLSDRPDDADLRTLGRKVDTGIKDPRDALQGLFDPSHARGAGHALDGEDYSLPVETGWRIHG